MSKKICLVLGSGGSKGLTHLGVIKALVEANFEITQIVGTSSGALVGGLYAANPNCGELEKIIQNIGYLELVKIFVDWPNGSGLMDGGKIEKFLDEIYGKKKIEDLPIKFKAVCTDIVKGEKFIFDKGKLSTAIRASCGVPGLFSPFRYEGKLLIDGGALNPVPVFEVDHKEDEKIVAVGLYGRVFPKSYQQLVKANLTQIAYTAMQTMFCKLADYNMAGADIRIMPLVNETNILNFVKTKKYIHVGYETTMKMVPEIEKLFT